MPVINTDNLE